MNYYYIIKKIYLSKEFLKNILTVAMAAILSIASGGLVYSYITYDSEKELVKDFLQGDGTVTIAYEIDELDIPENEEYVLPVYILNKEEVGIEGIEVYIEYDSDKLEISRIDTNDALDVYVESSAKDNLITIIGANSKADNSIAIKIGEIVLTKKQDGKATLNLLSTDELKISKVTDPIQSVFTLTNAEVELI